MESGIKAENKAGSKIKTFKDLLAWKEAHKLVLLTYQLTHKFPKEELFGIVSQMRRAAVSITSNIAEGFGRYSYKEKAQFYSISQGSITELQNQLIISKDLGYISGSEFDKADMQAFEAHRIIHGLRQGAIKNHEHE